MKIQKICKQCGKEFTAQKLNTNYCGHRCASRAYKSRKRYEDIDVSNRETIRIKNKSLEEIKAKEFLTVKDAAILLNCSVETIYYYIGCSKINAINLGKRLTRIKRSEIDRLFQSKTQDKPIEPKKYDISECYYLGEIQEIYKISNSAVHSIVNRHNIPRIKKGKYVYVPKEIIDNLLK